MRNNDSLEKTLMLGKIEGRKRGQQRMRCLDAITDSMDMSLSTTPGPTFWTSSHPTRRWCPAPRPCPHCLLSPGVPKPQPAVCAATEEKAVPACLVWEPRAQGTVPLGRHATRVDSGLGGPW